jgi:hypothetical protein
MILETDDKTAQLLRQLDGIIDADRYCHRASGR